MVSPGRSPTAARTSATSQYPPPSVKPSSDEIAARRHEAEDTAAGAGIGQVAEYRRGNRRGGRPPIPRTPERRQSDDGVRLHQGCKRDGDGARDPAAANQQPDTDHQQRHHQRIGMPVVGNLPDHERMPGPGHDGGHGKAQATQQIDENGNDGDLAATIARRIAVRVSEMRVTAKKNICATGG